MAAPQQVRLLSRNVSYPRLFWPTQLRIQASSGAVPRLPTGYLPDASRPLLHSYINGRPEGRAEAVRKRIETFGQAISPDLHDCRPVNRYATERRSRVLSHPRVRGPGQGALLYIVIVKVRWYVVCLLLGRGLLLGAGLCPWPGVASPVPVCWPAFYHDGMVCPCDTPLLLTCYGDPSCLSPPRRFPRPLAFRSHSCLARRSLWPVGSLRP